jgi:hypothetical protein
MADTLATMRTKVKFELGNKSGIDTVIDDAINDAIIEVAQTFQPQELIASASGSAANQTSSYSFSSIFSVTDVLAIIGVRNTTDDYRLKNGSLLEFMLEPKLTTQSSNFGRPNKWTRQGNNLILYSQIPDSTARTIEIYYVQRPAELTADADTFPLNREWERPVALLASSYVWGSLNNSEKAQLKDQQYQSTIVRRDTPEELEDESPERQLVPVSNVDNW